MREPFPPRDVVRPSALSDAPPTVPAMETPAGFPTDERPAPIDERLAALAIRRVLDHGTEQLPYRVSERLAAARARAAAQVPAAGTPDGGRPQPAVRSPSAGSRNGLRWRAAAVGASLATLVAVSVLVDAMQEEQSAEEMAEVNNALLTDDLPLDAYADRGFGVYLVNTRLPQAQAVSLSLRR